MLHRLLRSASIRIVRCSMSTRYEFLTRPFVREGYHTKPVISMTRLGFG